MVYIDFLPNQSADYHGQYDNFRSLIDRANNWLERNTNMEVITCETISVRADDPATGFNSELMICPGFQVQNTAGNHRFDKEAELHGLRLWYLGHEDIDEKNNNEKTRKNSSKIGDNVEAQKIGYTTLIPRPGVGTKVNQYLKSTKKVYEPIAATIARHNEDLKDDPLNGHILNVQSVRIPYDEEEGPGDPEETYHRYGDTEMQVIRVFYNHGKNFKLRERIGFADFMPSQTSDETFTQMFSMADDWIRQQTNLRVCHIQTVFSNKSDDPRLYVDTQKPLITIKFNMTLIRAIRVWYLRPNDDEEVRFPKMPALKFQTFEPIMKRTEEDVYVDKKVKMKSGKTKIKKVKQTKVELEPMDTMLVVAKKAVAELKNKRIGILGAETDTAYVNERGEGTCERMKMMTDMRIKRAIRFYTFDVPKGVIISPTGRSEKNTSEACVIL